MFAIENIGLWLELTICAGTMVLVFMEVFDKGVVAAIGAFALLLLGFLSPEQASHAIDFETLSLLLGMMGVVGIASSAGIFELLSIRMLRFTGGHPLPLFIFSMVLTLLLSSFLNNATTILIVLPLTIEMARGIGLNPRPFALGEIFFANIGGLLTLIGDPVNTIVGSEAGLSMTDFLRVMSIPVFTHFLIVMGFLGICNRKMFRNISGDFLAVLRNRLVIRNIEDRIERKALNSRFVAIASAMIALTILAMLEADRLGLSAGSIALLGAVLSMLACSRFITPEQVFHHIEWGTLFFYLGLFVIVGAVEETGMLASVGSAIVAMTADPALLIVILIVVTGTVSALVDNVPFVTVMIPIIRTIQEEGTLFDAHPEVLWWALCLGAVMGGMATPFGSSANIVAIGTLQKLGEKMPTLQYMRYSLPVSLSGMAVACFYLIMLYEL